MVKSSSACAYFTNHSLSTRLFLETDGESIGNSFYLRKATPTAPLEMISEDRGRAATKAELQSSESRSVESGARKFGRE